MLFFSASRRQGITLFCRYSFHLPVTPGMQEKNPIKIPWEIILSLSHSAIILT
jgi:hypothetical protein